MGDIRHTLSNGQVIQFEAGTPPDVQNRVLAQIRSEIEHPGATHQATQIQDPGTHNGQGPSRLEAVKGGIDRGIQFGLQDEIAGAAAVVARPIVQGIRSLAGEEPLPEQSIGETFSEGRDDARAVARSQRNAYPATSGVTEFVAGMGALPVKAASAAIAAGSKVPSMASNVGHAAKTGAASGAVVGFAEGEGFDGRIENSALGAALGGALGAGASTLLDGLPRLKRLLVGPSKGPAMDRHVAASLISAFEKDGFTRAAAINQIRQWEVSGGDIEMLADIGGPAVLRLARAARSASPSAASKADTGLMGRHLEQGERLTGAAQAATGQKGEAFHKSIDTLSAQRSVAARPLYQEAFNSGPVHSDWFAGAAKHKTVRKALKKGRKLQEVDDLADGVQTAHPQAIVGFNKAGEPILGAVPSVREWDAVKRGLDAMIEKNRDKLTGQVNAEGRSLSKLRARLLEEMDRVPAYKEARAAWSGKSEAMDLVSDGRRFMSQDPELITKRLSKAAAEDQQFYRMGVVRAIEDRLDKVRESADATLIFTPILWKRIGAALGEDATGQLKKAVDREVRMSKTLNTVSRGSQTQDKMSDAAMLGRPENNSTIGDLLRGDISGGALKEAAAYLNRRAQGVTENVGERLGDMMFTPPGQARASGTIATASAEQLEEAVRRHLTQREVGAGLGRAGGMLTGP